MKSYAILNLPKEFKYAIVALSYVNPFDEIEEIEKELSDKNFNGEIIFDLLLCNGLNKNRYIKIYFDGNHLDIDSISIMHDISINTRKIITNFIQINDLLLGCHVLPSSHSYLIKSGNVV